MGCATHSDSGSIVEVSMMSTGGCNCQSDRNISQLPGITLSPRSLTSRGRLA